AFHTAHKMQLLAHSTDGYRALGRLVGGAKAVPRVELRERYEAAFMAVLRKPATPGRHANVLMHMLGHLKAHLDEAGKAELLGLIEDHRAGLVPLVVPVTMLRHHVRRLSVAYLLGQTYLEPHPKELMLRNHV
ncbi:MAG TPA: YbgA family protein, partial [Polyangia bacterium]|nr:YbgA family protein [Polyangia bacterium]